MSPTPVRRLAAFWNLRSDRSLRARASAHSANSNRAARMTPEGLSDAHSADRLGARAVDDTDQTTTACNVQRRGS